MDEGDVIYKPYTERIHFGRSRQNSRWLSQQSFRNQIIINLR